MSYAANFHFIALEELNHVSAENAAGRFGMNRSTILPVVRLRVGTQKNNRILKKVVFGPGAAER